MKKSIFLLGFLCLFCHGVNSQKKAEPSLNLSQGAIINEMHQNHIGEIAFMEAFLPFTSFTEEDFLSEVKLSKTNDLNLRIFLAKTLTAYLNQLAPELSVSQLCDNGNFMFSFWVDGDAVYQFKIPYGAGSCAYKNEQTVYGIPLVRQDNPDHWGRFLWQRFMFQGGGDDALSVGEHQLVIQVQPYLDNVGVEKKTIIGDVIAEGSVKVIREPIAVTEAQRAIQDISKTEWSLYSDNFNENLIKDLNEQIANETLKDITSIVVIKDGKLALEEYFNGAKRKTLHDTRSMTKSFTSSLIGIAINEGLITSEKATIGDFYELQNFENFDPRKENISVSDLLQMNTVFDGNDADASSPGNEENMYPTKDWVKFVLDLPIRESSEHWSYFTGGVVLLGDILEKQTNNLEKYAKEKLFKPLNISKVKWQKTPTGVANTAGSCRLTTLDYAKYGQLYLNKGKWKDQQIIPSDWVHLSHTKHQQTSDGQHYGYLFWNSTFEIAGSLYEAYMASGNGGNHIVMIKELEMVIVITAKAYNKPYAHPQSHKITEHFLIPAFLAK